jgi:hypothetical protein
MKNITASDITKLVCTICQILLLFLYLWIYSFRGMPKFEMMIFVHVGFIFSFMVSMENYKRKKDAFSRKDIFYVVSKIVVNYMVIVASIFIWDGINI